MEIRCWIFIVSHFNHGKTREWSRALLFPVGKPESWFDAGMTWCPGRRGRIKPAGEPQCTQTSPAKKRDSITGAG